MPIAAFISVSHAPAAVTPGRPATALRPGLGIQPARWAAVAVLLVVLLAVVWLGQTLALRYQVGQQSSQANQDAAAHMASQLSVDQPSRPFVQVRLALWGGLMSGAEFRWLDAEGAVLARQSGASLAADRAIDRAIDHAVDEAAAAPSWFVRLAPLAIAAGVAPLADEGKAGTLWLRRPTTDAWAGLWQAAQQQALVLAMLGAGMVAALQFAALRQRRQTTGHANEMAAQLRGLGTGAAQLPLLSVGPALRPLALAVQSVAEQRAALIRAHVEQMEVLRRYAHADALTGLPNRRIFTADLDEALADSAGPGGVGLLLLRVRDLYGMNLRHGHVRTDQILLTMTELLRAYPRQVGGCRLGRLNGSDFALLLPVMGQAETTARSLLAALQPMLSPLDAASGVAIGAAELLRPTDGATALSMADEALARAEVNGRFGMETIRTTPPASSGGQTRWLVAIHQALDQGRTRLDERPVRGADSRLLHLDCTLQLQLNEAGPFEPAARWFALAVRTRLAAAADSRAVGLALRAIATDDQARSLQLAGESLLTPGFVDDVTAQLTRVPQLACRLWLALPEAVACDHTGLLREAAGRWRACGARFALAQAGDRLSRTPQLLDLGLDCVRVHPRYVAGIAQPGNQDAQRFLRALVQLVQGVGLQIAADGVSSAQDLALLWSSGFDAASGPALDGNAGLDDADIDTDFVDDPSTAVTSAVCPLEEEIS